MMPIAIVGITVLSSSAVYIPIFLRTLRRERKVIKLKEKLIEEKQKLIEEERRQFFNAIQEKAAANAMTPCRTCVTCKRVVHRYSPVSGGVLCYECDVSKKALR